MTRKKAFFHSLLILLLFSAPAFAQKSEADKDPLALFRMGQELYNANHFAAAQKVFRDYLATNDNRYELRADAQYYIATSAMELFQNDAEALLTQFTQNYPEHPKARLVNYSMGKFQFREKKYDKVVAAFKNVDESDLSQKERYEYYFMNGYANYRSGDKAEAKTYLAKAKDVDNDNKAMASLYYGVISYEEGNYKEALSEFLKIKDDKKAKAFVPVYVTQIYLLQGKYDKVIEFGEQALNAVDENNKPAANDKSRADVLRYVAEAYFMTKNYQKAAERYDALAQGGYTLSDQQYYQLGYAQYLSEDYTGAISSFNKINIKEDTLGQNVAYHLAGAYVKTGDLVKARNSYRFASKLKFLPKLQENALLNYAKLSYEQNYQTEAIDAFKSFINKYPKSPDATETNELLSQILLAADNPKEALEVLKGLPSRTGKLAEAYQKVLYLYGLELFKNKEYDESEDYFSQSLEHAVDRKTKALAYFWLGEAQYRRNEAKEALSNYKNFLYVSEAKQTPYYAVAYYNLGYCYFKTEDYTLAKNYFNQYLNAESHDESPRATDAVLRAADCNFALKSYAAAQTGYDQIIRKNASEADYAYYQKGIIQGLQGNPDGKISTMRSLASTYKKSAYIDDALYSIGETYMNNENYQQAIKEFQAMNRDYPKNPYFRVAQLNIGQSYINMGQADKGVSVLKKIVSTYPATTEARTAMRFIQNSYTERGLTDSLAAFYADPINKNMIPNSQDSILYTSAFNNVKRNDCPATITSMQKYLSKYPNGYFAVDASYYLAECYYKNPSPAKAQQYYNFVIARSPNQYMEQSLANSAYLYYNDKDYTMAAKRYEQLEEIATKKDLTIYALQGELTSNFNLNDYQKTLDIGNKILGLGYTDEGLKTSAQYYMGKSFLALNQEENAMASLTQVMKVNDAEMGAEANYEVAHIYFLQEKYEDSRKSIMALKDNYAGYDYWRAKAFILLADIYVKDGDTFQAKSTLQSIIDKYRVKDDGIIESAKAKLEEIKANETGK